MNMFRYWNPALLLILLMHSLTPVQASCDVQGVLGKIILPASLERSKWSKQAERFLIDIDYKAPVRLSEKLFGFESRSIANKNIETLNILKDLESYQMRVSQFEKNFQQIYGRTPVREDYFEFYESRNKIFKSAMDQFYREIKKATRSESVAWKETVESQLSSTNKMLEAAKKDQTLEGAIEKLDVYGRRMSGSLTELRTGVSLNGVQQISFELRESKTIMDRLSERLQKFENKLPLLEKEFPKMGKSATPVKGRVYSDQEKIEEIKKWVASKEIDVVRTGNGKTKWVEVKRNELQFNDSNFSSAGMGKKSYRYQILETKEIIRFLGMENEIELEYLATGGIQDALKKSLQTEGIRVLEP